jgi:hypothetical protein
MTHAARSNRMGVVCGETLLADHCTNDRREVTCATCQDVLALLDKVYGASTAVHYFTSRGAVSHTDYGK